MANQVGENPTPKPYITNNVPLLLQKHSENYKVL